MITLEKNILSSIHSFAIIAFAPSGAAGVMAWVKQQLIEKTQHLQARLKEQLVSKPVTGHNKKEAFPQGKASFLL